MAFSDAQVKEHDRLFRRPGWIARRRLNKAIACFEGALAINPASWQSRWVLGKIHQRLGDAAAALACFTEAHRLAPDQVDVAREAAIAAADLGNGPEAVRFARSAVAAQPENPGLLSNLALALLINGELTGARNAIEQALQRAPGDGPAAAVRNIIDDVIAGRRPTSNLRRGRNRAC